ncbi:MAG: SDR family NAD(P)-dependent oxidoreductase [Acidimicrobiia bacterium]
MKSFNGRIAVVTGGGSGIGRELVRQLAGQGANVAMGDLFADAMAETKRLCEADDVPAGVRITAHVVDVADQSAMDRFAAEVARHHETDCIHALFNNAGVGGGASFVNAPREEWERVFSICWNGVYFGCRSFLPLLMKADEGAVVNTSSANGFWAAFRPNVTHTAYSTAKFAVKGFTESLINDFRHNAPHLTAHVVMPGGVGTQISLNSRRVLMGGDTPFTQEELIAIRQRFAGMGIAGAVEMDEAEIKREMARQPETKPTTPAQAATIILDAVKAERWRIVVGEDAQRLDRRVRTHPDSAYDLDFPGYEPFVEGEEAELV